MIVHQVFAQIFKGEVKNIIVCNNYEMANWLARAAYGEDAFAVDCLQYSCGIGDKYRDGIFYHVIDGKEDIIPYTLSPEQLIPSLKAQVSYLSMMTGYEAEVEYE